MSNSVPYRGERGHATDELHHSTVSIKPGQGRIGRGNSTAGSGGELPVCFPSAGEQSGDSAGRLGLPKGERQLRGARKRTFAGRPEEAGPSYRALLQASRGPQRSARNQPAGAAVIGAVPAGGAVLR